MTDPSPAADPKLYLVTPMMFAPERFADDLAAALDAGPAACVRLRLRGAARDELAYAIDVLRPVCHSREVALLVSDYVELAREFGLDGVHFELGANAQIEARAALGPDAIIGVSCGASRHAAMLAGERGADYVAFGPVGPGAGEPAGPDLFAWWQELMEPPVVAEGGTTPEIAAGLRGAADFVAAGEALWRHPDGAAAGAAAFHRALAEEATAER